MSAQASTASEAAAAIAGWRPRGLDRSSQAFCREAVRRAGPASAQRARALLWAAAKLVAFGASVGLEPSPQALLREAVIERFIAVGCSALSPASRRTLRTNLRSLARGLEDNPQPEPAPLCRERAKAPYSQAEIAGYLRLAAAQPTLARRSRATALICLGAGAGLIGAELRALCGSDLHRRSGGLVVAVSGPRARVVPVIARYHEPLGRAAAFAGSGYLLGARSPARRNLTDALVGALSADPSLPRLEAGRLRSSWLCECAQAIGLSAFMGAAGVRCTQRLGDLLAELPRASEAEAVALIGGADGGGGKAPAP